MQENKFQELETRASEVGVTDQIKKLEARALVHQEIEAMKAEGKAFELSAEEEAMLKEFRVFKLRMKKDGEVFTWQTRKPDGVQIVPESTPVLTHPD
jgi:hypothetical protein